MASAQFLIKPTAFPAIAAWFLAAVILLAPLAAGYAWVSGGHAGESHVHRHHLMEKLAPHSHHHAAARPASGQDAATDGDVPGSVILHGAAAFALPAVIAPAFIPDLASYFDAATAALLAAAIAALVLTHYSVPVILNPRRPQTETAPPGRPPSG